MPTTNLQLPHLLSFCKAFELRTSRYCRDVNVASKKWALQSGFIDEDERRRIPGLQLALLASLSNPTCDMAQLLLVTQFLILHVHWIDKTPESGDAAFNEFVRSIVLVPHMFSRIHPGSGRSWYGQQPPAGTRGFSITYPRFVPLGPSS